MAKPKNKKRKSKRPQKNAESTGKPWLRMSTGLRAMLLLSLVLAAFITWQLYPSEGLFRALLWGLGFGVAIWGVFYLSYAFNTWVRRRD